jgi:thiosulfate/3-mercaptopyruvate sulfurtransferase
MAFTTLIDTARLAEHLDDPAYSVVDCRWRLDDPSWGPREYLARHVRGAAFASLDADLSGPKTGVGGRHPLPDPAALRQTLGRLGIGAGVQVVAYDQDSCVYASRLWWLLRWLGHVDVAVLDGGFAKWTAEGRPSRDGFETRPPREFTGQLQLDLSVDADEVAAMRGRPGWRLLDARARERYLGEVEPLDRVAGHIPGAVNYPYTHNLDGPVFRSKNDLRHRLRAALGGAAPDHVVCYCGSGVTACHTVLALEHAGLPGAKLYPGSWSEWSSDPGKPIATGDES